MTRELAEAARSERPTPTESLRTPEAGRSRQLHDMFVISCAGGAMEVMENVSDGEDCDPRLDDVQGCSSTS